MKIKTIKAILLAVLAFFLFISCRTTKTEYIPVETVKTITETVRDTVVDVKLVPYREEIATPKDSSYLENPYAYSWAWFDGKLLHHNLGIFDRPTPTKIQYIDRVVEVEVEKPYPVKGDTEYTNILKWWQTMFIGLGVLMLLQILVLTGLGVAKLINWIRR